MADPTATPSGAPGDAGTPDQLPRIRTPPPGPATRALAERLRAAESRNVTHLGPRFPVFWTRARGVAVEDADGNVYLDLTGAFGVAAAGHAHPRITAAIREQAGILPHAMGDVHPPVRKVELLERLASLTPWGHEARGVLASSGSEAVEVALKTALLATGRPGIVAFRGGYHGLTMGSLAVTGRADFREPFRERLYGGVRFVPFPGSAGGVDGSGGAADPDGADVADPEEALEALDEALPESGAVIVEPIQGRAGVRVPPAGFLAEVARRTREAGALLVLDEIFTGLGRTGRRFAFEHEGLVPDLLCLGKALGGGIPLSACIGPRSVMDAWPPSEGEALHTSTFLGHPLACASALAFLDVLEEEGLAARAAALGSGFQEALARDLSGVGRVREVRGRGLFLGIELAAPGDGVRVAEAALRRGLLVLAAGPGGEVVELAPPLVVEKHHLEAARRLLVEAVGEVAESRGGGPPVSR
jgi:4-aminobutyrate aminotransferase-like enzyme